jgi:hypothetical protein
VGETQKNCCADAGVNEHTAFVQRLGTVTPNSGAVRLASWGAPVGPGELWRIGFLLECCERA